MSSPANRETCAWAAGFVDGEGCFTGAVTKGTFYPMFTVSQVHRAPLAKLQALFSAGSVIARPARNNWQRQYLYQVFGYEKVQAIATTLWPWLGRVKRAQAESVLRRHVQTRLAKERN